MLATGKLGKDHDLKSKISKGAYLRLLEKRSNGKKQIIKGYKEYEQDLKNNIFTNITNQDREIIDKTQKALETKPPRPKSTHTSVFDVFQGAKQKSVSADSNADGEPNSTGSSISLNALKELIDAYQNYLPYVINTDIYIGTYNEDIYKYNIIDAKKDAKKEEQDVIKTNCMGMLERLFPTILDCRSLGITIPECKPRKKCFEAPTTEPAPANAAEESAATKSVSPSAQLLSLRPSARRGSYTKTVIAAGKKRKQSKKYKNKNRKKNNISQKKKRKN